MKKDVPVESWDKLKREWRVVHISGTHKWYAQVVRVSSKLVTEQASDKMN